MIDVPAHIPVADKQQDGEYKVIYGRPSDCQIKLNQWKHDYLIKILGVTSNPSYGATVGNVLTIVLIRYKK